MFDFSPYNYWVLYFAIGLTVVFLFMTLGKLLALGKAVQAYKPQLDTIQNNVRLSAVKAQAVAGRTKQIMGIVKPALAAVGLLLAIKAVYDKTDDNGVSGFTLATNSVLAQRNAKRNLIKNIRKEIGI